MPFISAFFYDWFMKDVEEKCIQAWREELLQDVQGKIFEVGAGTGANLPYYSLKAKLILSEPDTNMRAILKQKLIENNLEAEVNTDSAENISIGSETIDTVVATLVCCSVINLHTALLEIKRILKPGGQFIFLEHVAAEHGSRDRKWQNRITPIWRKIAGNCHLNRETEAAISQAGFQIQRVEHAPMGKSFTIEHSTCRGVAVKPLVIQD